MGEVPKGVLLINKIARTLTRAWMEIEFGQEFGVSRLGLKPSLQISLSPHRPFPNASVKWNKLSSGTTNPLQIENATVRYLSGVMPGWGNNRSPNNNYTVGSTKARGFDSPFKTVFFDDISETPKFPVANEAFTGNEPGTRDVEAWVFLSRAGTIKPGSVVNFQNSKGQCVGETITTRLVNAGFAVSVVPYAWWERYNRLQARRFD